jgi:hypothetical protein
LGTVVTMLCPPGGRAGPRAAHDSSLDTGPTRTLEAKLIAYARNLVAHAPRDTLCLVTVSRGHGGGADCGDTLAAIQHGGLPTDDNGTFAAIVPDGVTTVTLRFAPAQGRRAASVTGVVRGNVLAVRGPRLAFGSTTSPRATVVWRSARGRVLKTLPPAPADALTAYCHTNPIACIALLGGVSEESGSSQIGSSSSVAAAPARGG